MGGRRPLPTGCSATAAAAGWGWVPAGLFPGGRVVEVVLALPEGGGEGGRAAALRGGERRAAPLRPVAHASRRVGAFLRSEAFLASPPSPS